MAREIFKNLPDKSTPLNATKLNGIFNGEESMGSIVVEDIECKNLLYTPYNENNKLTVTAPKNDYGVETDYHVYLEAGVTYTFKCETTGNASQQEIFLLKDKGYDYYIRLEFEHTFVPEQTGNYYLRYDVNVSGETHSFWNFYVAKENEFSGFVKSKDFDNENLKGRILWVNPNTTTAMGYSANYITLADDDFDELEFWCYTDINNHTLITAKTRKGLNASATSMAGWPGQLFNRSFEKSSNDRIYSMSACYAYGHGITPPFEINENLIPAYVVGYKNRIIEADATANTVSAASLEETE